MARGMFLESYLRSFSNISTYSYVRSIPQLNFKKEGEIPKYVEVFEQEKLSVAPGKEAEI